jgi:hypothetical protein
MFWKTNGKFIFKHVVSYPGFQGFDDQKFKNLKLKKIIFFQNFILFYPQASRKDVQATGDASPTDLKREHPTHQNIILYFFVDHFYPPGSGYTTLFTYDKCFYQAIVSNFKKR